MNQHQNRTGSGRLAFARLGLLAGAFLVALLLVPGAAGATTITFGSDLSQAPDVNPPTQCGAASCSFTTTDVPRSTSQSDLPPAGAGTITQVRVRMGSTTGPVKVVILRGEIDPNTANVSCCTDLHESAPFTPQANGITTEQVNLPVLVQNSPDPNNGLESFDLVGLTLLENGVEIPLVDERTPPINEEPSDFYKVPAWTLGQTAGASDVSGYLLDMQATWTNGGGGGTGGGLPTLTFPSGNALKVKGKNAVVQLACGGAAACDGNVAVQNVPLAGATAASAKHKHKVVTYASGSFGIAAGKSQSVTAKLSHQGRKAAKHHKRIKVYVNIHLETSHGTKLISHSVTIRF